MIIGCIREIKNNENRVGLTPEGIKKLTEAGHKVLIQETAVNGAGYHDYECKQAGAILEKEPIRIVEKCDILVKVKEPLAQEYYLLEKMKNKTVFTYFHLSGVDPKLTQSLLENKVTAIAYETVQDQNGRLPLLDPMSRVAGIAAVQYIAELSQIKYGGRGRTCGFVPGTKQTNIMIVGGGVVGESAAKTAAGMGSKVKVFDINPNRVKELQNILNEYLGPVLSKNVEVLVPNKENFEATLKETDGLVGAVLVAGTKAPEVVNEQQVRSMKKGAVIIDVAIDQGGCIWGSRATSHSNPWFELEEKIFSAVPNIPGQYARQSTQALTAATLPYLLNMANKGVNQALKEDAGFMKGVNTYNGSITFEPVAKDLGMQSIYKDIKTLI
jgi:alanine dehydrogenase